MSGNGVDRAAERRRLLRAVGGRDRDEARDSGDGERRRTDASDDHPDSTAPARSEPAADPVLGPTLVAGDDAGGAAVVVAETVRCLACNRVVPDRPDACPECGSSGFERGI